MLETTLKLLIICFGRRRMMHAYMSAIRRTDRPTTDVVVCQEAVVGIIIVFVAAATAAARM